MATMTDGVTSQPGPASAPPPKTLRQSAAAFVGTHFWRLFALAALAVVVYAGWQVQATWEEAQRRPPRLDITTRSDDDYERFAYTVHSQDQTRPATVVLRDHATVVGYYRRTEGRILQLATVNTQSSEIELVGIPWDDIAYIQVHVKAGTWLGGN